jgi:hypothetical protein
MTKHRPKLPADTAPTAPESALDAALRAVTAELERRKAYSELRRLERRITDFPPVPGDPPYVESFQDPPKS